MAKLELILPNKLNTRDMCCCIDSNITEQRVILNSQHTGAGYKASQIVTLNNESYNLDIVINRLGDMLGGSAKITKVFHNKVIDNVLDPQLSGYPQLPFANLWTGLKAYGIGDSLSLALSDEASTIPTTGPINSSVTVTLSADIARLSTNVVEDSVTTTFSLTGSDATGWTNSGGGTVTAKIIQSAEVLLYPISMSNLNVIPTPGSITCSGNLKIQPGVGRSSISGTFNTPPLLSDYNSKFPWNNQIALVDSAILGNGIFPYDAFTLGLPDDYRMIVFITVSGVQ
jgi:hypothetical protein